VSIIRRVLGTNNEERNLNGLGLIPSAFDRVPGLSAPLVNENSVLGLSTAWACVTISPISSQHSLSILTFAITVSVAHIAPEDLNPSG
jgi:hypothetical protein